MFDWIAFDADDTLWLNEPLYQAVQDRFVEIMAAYGQADRARDALFQTEMNNLPLYGYGVKSFGLSLIETAVRLTGGRVRGDDVGQLLDLIRGMVQTPVRLLDGVAEVVAELAQSHQLMLITKGDLLDQERKLAQSGLAPYFDRVEIVSTKTAAVYRDLLARHGIAPSRFLMVGNSLRSDVLPVLEIGGQAVHIPYHTTWAHEAADPPGEGYVELEHIGQLPAFVHQAAVRVTRKRPGL
ncbi:MAG TPA: HAD family hydrolase [Anaerolineae bacterium]|nr:HAD family hydrolase [Anaerolineae bacterium]